MLADSVDMMTCRGFKPMSPLVRVSIPKALHYDSSKRSFLSFFLSMLLIIMSFCFPLDVKCSSRNTCQGCFGQPGCGWCGDSRGTGIGVCMDGTDRGAINGVCPASRWYYTDCPSKHLQLPVFASCLIICLANFQC